MASVSEKSCSVPSASKQRFQAIDEWQQDRVRLIAQIALEVKVEEKNQVIDDEQLPMTPDANIVRFLDDHLQEALFGQINSGGVSETGSTIMGDNEESHDSDTGLSSDLSSGRTLMHPLPALSRQISINSRIDESAGQAVVVKQEPSRFFNCYKDGEAGVMALNGDQLVYADWVKSGCDGSGNLKLRVASNIKESTAYHNVIFPHIDGNVRVVDIDFFPAHNVYVLGIVITQTTRSAWLYLFDSRFTETEKAIKRWVPCNDGEILARLCCTSTGIYEIVRRYRKNFIILLTAFGTEQERKSAEELFSPELMLSAGGLRLADLSCTPKNDRLAVAYNCSDGFQKGPIGVYVFDPTKDWMLIARVDLGQTVVEFNVPRLAFLNKVDLFVALNSRNGNLVVFNPQGVQQGKRCFIVYVNDYEDDEPIFYPYNICVSQSWAAIRYNRLVTVHRIND